MKYTCMMLIIITMTIIHEHLCLSVESCCKLHVHCWICSYWVLEFAPTHSYRIFTINYGWIHVRLNSLSRFHRWLLADECALPGRCWVCCGSRCSPKLNMKNKFSSIFFIWSKIQRKIQLKTVRLVIALKL